jgi:glucan 1,3-beta-glucosidase
MRLPLGLFAATAACIAAAWWWLGQPVPMPPSPLAAGEKLHCVSYAPFRGAQNPLSAGTHIEPWQIDEDLARLARFTNCVRSYSIEHGLDKIPEIARKHGLKVLHGLWLSSHADKNRVQVETTIALAKQFPDVIQAVIVGNEVLLRGEMSPTDLANTMRHVKSQISMPVTYADVWEFWLRHREVYNAADYVTIHILPYWEDFPIPAEQAAAHVEAIRKRVVATFPDKRVFIGEVGWPSAGRMREGALPSPANQARILHDVLNIAKRENYQVNVIEAFDQPWKRQLEGTVGGYWGLFDDRTREPKFIWGEALSNHPLWRWQAAGGVAFAVVIFAAAFFAGRGAVASDAPRTWGAVALTALFGGALIGWTIESTLVQSFGLGGWARSLGLALVALAAPIVGAAAIRRGSALPSFAGVIGRTEERARDPLVLALGALLILLCVLAVLVALGLAFDPRYRDFPFAQLTAGVLPFLVLSLAVPPSAGVRPAAERLAAAILGLSTIYIVVNETMANWQALWTAAALAALVVILTRMRAAPG